MEVQTQTPKIKRRVKIIRDANKPKRPLSAYLLWLSENRQQIQSENPALKPKDIMRKGAELWKEVGDKSVWKDRAEELKGEYRQAVARYEEENGLSSAKRKKQ